MTKREFQQKFGAEAATLMQNPTFHITLDVAREECPYANGGGAMEATSIIRNEGRITGWNECLKYLKTIARSEPEPPPVVHVGLYEDPTKTKSDRNTKK